MRLLGEVAADANLGEVARLLPVFFSDPVWSMLTVARVMTDSPPHRTRFSGVLPVHTCFAALLAAAVVVTGCADANGGTPGGDGTGGVGATAGAGGTAGNAGIGGAAGDGAGGAAGAGGDAGAGGSGGDGGAGSDGARSELVFVQDDNLYASVKGRPGEVRSLSEGYVYPDWILSLAVSPDGEHVAYFFEDRTGGDFHEQMTKVVRVDGQGDEVIVNLPLVYPVTGGLYRASGWYQWHPSGGWLAYTAAEGPAEGTPTGLRLIRPNGTARHTKSVPGAGVMFDGPIWNADGTRLAYVEDGEEAENDTVRTNTTVGDNHAAIDETGFVPIHFRYQWSPDGTELLYKTDAGLYVAAADGSNRRTVAEGFLLRAAWSPNGERVAFTQSETFVGNAALYTSRPDGSDRRKINGPLTGSSSPDFYWSPTGDHIAYIAKEERASYHDLYMSRPDGSEHRRVNATLGDGDSVRWASFSSWSPDGSHIAYQVRNADAEVMDLYVAAADGSTNHKLNTPGMMTGTRWWAVWNRDGTRMLYTERAEDRGPSELWTNSSDGSDPRKLNAPLPPGGTVFRYEWSPDGRHVAFTANRESTSDRGLFACAADGSDLVRISTPGVLADYQHFAWVPAPSKT